MFLIEWQYTLAFTILLHYAVTDTKLSAEEIAKHPAWAKLDAVDCGDNARDRIIGGTNAALGEFPWIVRLGYMDEDELVWLCGGALLTDRHVITAGHCVQKSEYGYDLKTVRVGEYDVRTDPDCELKVCAPAVQDRAVKNITSHPSYDKPPFHNDVAIIELETPITFNDYVAPICLPKTTEQMANVLIGEKMTVAGWGKTNMTTEERGQILQVVSIPVVDPALCDSFGKGYKVAESEICAGTELNKDSCGGDSGGPLMKIFDTPEGPKNYLIGVVSFGPTICGIKKPGVYTSVSHFLKWILDRLV
ncbi:CLIP domain-containing serine protease 2-like isoform X2 [Trichoplusia ni]|uniref:limulus clotting factor C n=1 Tax=Trichoplusia ni TaxID=7111 RepID=A0A7E5W4R5_TRINI|nr:CLIP domain-containing serine protease 2-like isoform X2 [Trichoplusia ni]